MKLSDLQIARDLVEHRKSLHDRLKSLKTDDYRLCVGREGLRDEKTYSPVLRATDAMIAEAQKATEKEIDDVEGRLKELDIEIEPHSAPIY